MRQPLAPLVAVALALLLCPAPGGAGVQWTQTTRTVGSEVIVTNATEFALDSDNQTSTVMGLFIAVASADTMVTGVSGVSTSEQDSDLFARGLMGSGSFWPARCCHDAA